VPYSAAGNFIKAAASVGDGGIVLVTPILSLDFETNL
jgi:hypothetical protein